MGRKRVHVDYRQLYKDYYGIEFGPDMVVHHIDFNRANNDISNLLLMPKQLHAKYHFVMSMLFGLHNDNDLKKELMLTGPMVSIHYAKWLNHMADVLDEIKPWMNMKVDFEMYPRELFNSVYHTRSVITENSLRDEHDRDQVDKDRD